MTRTDPDVIIDRLEHLYALCNEAADVYRAAADAIAAEDLTTLFNQHAMHHASFAEQLRNHIWRLGETQAEQPITVEAAGVVYETYLDVKAALAGDDREAMLEAMSTAEDAMRAEYTRILETDIPAPIKDTLRRQHNKLSELFNGLHMHEAALS